MAPPLAARLPLNCELMICRFESERESSAPPFPGRHVARQDRLVERDLHRPRGADRPADPVPRRRSRIRAPVGQIVGQRRVVNTEDVARDAGDFDRSAANRRAVVGEHTVTNVDRPLEGSDRPADIRQSIAQGHVSQEQISRGRDVEPPVQQVGIEDRRRRRFPLDRDVRRDVQVSVRGKVFGRDRCDRETKHASGKLDRIVSGECVGLHDRGAERGRAGGVLRNSVAEIGIDRIEGGVDDEDGRNHTGLEQFATENGPATTGGAQAGQGNTEPFRE